MGEFRKSEKWHAVSLKGDRLESGGLVLADVEIEADSPWFSGHFPNEPTLPGIALLSMVSDLIRRRAAEKNECVTISGIRRVRFRLPVRPGAVLSISLWPPDRPNPVAGVYAFKIAMNGETACSGMMDVRTVAE
jgi:3-hydroxymyristoyl/3-hydroxydecanoyl-(acyl carrier protein) dehydratase